MHIRNKPEAHQAIIKPRVQSWAFFLPSKYESQVNETILHGILLRACSGRQGRGGGVDSSNTTVIHWSLTFVSIEKHLKGLILLSPRTMWTWLAKPQNVLRTTGIPHGRKLWQTWPFRKEMWLTYCIWEAPGKLAKFWSARSSVRIRISSSETFDLNETQLRSSTKAHVTGTHH